MVIVCSTEGSSIRTGWKRRVRAASFSMVRRYSSRVVAVGGGGYCDSKQGRGGESEEVNYRRAPRLAAVTHLQRAEVPSLTPA